ncbi:hypothetical protein ABH992_003240 [Bradyrhizobium yuanmingense]|uniref:PPM-type phosphatase domain-containing protein n=1 Tax=Bradyrhizobium yuanmingense TaxID=108015 RepID=A0ABV4GH62_9BRAD
MNEAIPSSLARLQSVAIGRFKIVGASVPGGRSLASKTPCQDHFTFAFGEGWVVAVASDGAGSAIRAADGSRIVSQEICRAVKEQLSGDVDYLHVDFFTQMEGAVICGIERARTQCLTEAGQDGNLEDFHATVVGAVLTVEVGLIFHIGDGAASAHRLLADAIDTVAFSPPENGEYLNETFFFTEDDWKKHLRCTSIDGSPEEVWLMTDGAYFCVVQRNTLSLSPATAHTIGQLVFDRNNQAEAKMLAAILSGQEANAKNDDDKTILIIRKHPSE